MADEKLEQKAEDVKRVFRLLNDTDYFLCLNAISDETGINVERIKEIIESDIKVSYVISRCSHCDWGVTETICLQRRYRRIESIAKDWPY